MTKKELSAMKKLFRLFKRKKTSLHYETLVNPKPRIGLQRMYKISIFIGLLLLSGISEAQISFDMGAGIDLRHKNPIAVSNINFQKNNAVISLVASCPISRKVSSPLYLGGSVGYDFKNIIPAVGYYNYYTSDGGNKVNKGYVGYSLRYSLQINENGGMFFQSMYVDKSVLISAGFHVDITI
jgi:hypothetical protein